MIIYNLRAFVTFALAAVGLFATVGASAQDFAQGFTACGATANDGQRLGCYDKLRDRLAPRVSAAAPKADSYKEIKLIDLKLDIRSLMGSKVATDGYIQVMGEILMLKSEAMDMTPIYVNADRISRDERRALLQCSAPMCRVRLAGTVEKVLIGPGVAADTITVR